LLRKVSATAGYFLTLAEAFSKALFISELRTALDDDARKPRFIETVSRRGYRFIATPSPITAAPVVQPSVSGAAAVGAPYFIGRNEPLSRLHRAWDIACSGKRAIVWIAGEPDRSSVAITPADSRTVTVPSSARAATSSIRADAGHDNRRPTDSVVGFDARALRLCISRAARGATTR
jgi:hypothetical protein